MNFELCHFLHLPIKQLPAVRDGVERRGEVLSCALSEVSCACAILKEELDYAKYKQYLPAITYY